MMKELIRSGLEQLGRPPQYPPKRRNSWPNMARPLSKKTR